MAAQIDRELAHFLEHSQASVDGLHSAAVNDIEPFDAAVLAPVTTAQLHYALICSPFIAAWLNAGRDQFLGYLQRFGWHSPNRDALAARLSECTVDSEASDTDFKACLRNFRNRELALIGLRDLLGLADTRCTLQALSDLADVCITKACEVASVRLRRRFGAAQNPQGGAQQLMIVAMGKLGGGELNFSSDIDLVFLFARSGQTSGPKVIDNQDYFRRLGQQLIDYLGDVTAQGFVYRVDMRLRPFGSSGPLAINLEAMERYLLTQARDWERYAWIKARAVTGEADDIGDLNALLRPFIYRRYLDYAVFDSLRDLKRQIGIKADDKGAQANVKLGAGGIREVEFIVQAFQLVRGGREVGLQCQSLAQVLKHLVELQHISRLDGDRLWNAYEFLRRTENRLQMVDDRQTHRLPEDDAARQRLAVAMRYPNYAAFEQILEAYRGAVAEMFDSVFAVSEHSGTNQFAEIWVQLRNEKADLSLIEPMLSEAGLLPATQIAEQLHAFTQGGRYQRYSNRAQDLIDELTPALLADIAATDLDRLATLTRVLELVHSIAGRTGYLQLLNDNPATRQMLIRLFAGSAWLADFVSRHPMVIDDVLNVQELSCLQDTAALVASLRAEVERHSEADLGVQMDMLRHFQQSRVMRIAAADICGLLPVMKVSDGLTWLAEATLTVATELVYREMSARYGLPGCVDADGNAFQPEFAIVAYGKLGGVELGYSSDLDIVFVHESAGTAQHSDGQRSLENPLYFSRLAQKLVHFIATLTPAGVLYEIDTRLRPNGRFGVLVAGLDSFARYQMNDAWTWEHQALVRARVVVGSPRLRERFATIRTEVVQACASQADLRDQVVNMREKMHAELAIEREGSFDLKHGRGGIADIEFMVQYLVLRNARNNRAILSFTDNIRQLESLEQHGFLPAELAAALTAAYLHFRGLQHRLAMQRVDGSLVPEDAVTSGHRQAVAHSWQTIMT